MVDLDLIKGYEADALHISSSYPQSEPIFDETAVDEKYQKGEMRIVTEQARYPLNTIVQLVTSKKYILRPDFQRRHRWDNVQKSRLIESFIINIPIPPVFLYERDYSEYEVMDGLQRITAICEFYENKFALEGLTEWPELNGLKYDGLPFNIRRGIDRRYLSSIILLKETAKNNEEAEQLKQLVFERINSGGAKLEYQESRNALYPSEFNKAIISMARNPVFCAIFDIPQPDESEDLENDIYSEELRRNYLFQTMRDVEIVLRFFALRQISSWGKEPLSKFLDSFAEGAINLPNEILPLYYDLFEQTINLAYNIFGENTFCLWRFEKRLGKYRWNKQPSLVLYDPIMLVLSNRLDQSEKLIEKRDDVLERMKRLFESGSDLFNGRNTSRSYVEDRVTEINNLINAVLA